MSERLVIRGADAVTAEDVLPGAMIELEAGAIVHVGSAGPSTPTDRVIDAGGLLAAAGLIELQLNGGWGADFTSDPDAMWQVGERLPATGVTTFLPTIISAPRDARDAALAALAAGPPTAHAGALPLGLHFEGPFLHPAAAGAHDPAVLRSPEQAEVGADDWSVERGVRLVTLAPELPGATGLIGALLGRGVRVSAGHSAADFEQALAGFAAGITYVTHLFNAMPPLHHRQPGLVGAALADRRVTVGLIPDGLHTHPAVLGLIAAAVGRERLSLVTDATAGLGQPAGPASLAGREVIVDEVSVRLAGNGRLAGSALAADEGLRRFMAMTGWSAADTLATMTAVPARLLGLADRGRLAAGARADIVLFTPALEVVATFVGGRAVFGPWR